MNCSCVGPCVCTNLNVAATPPPATSGPVGAILSNNGAVVGVVTGVQATPVCSACNQSPCMCPVTNTLQPVCGLCNQNPCVCVSQSGCSICGNSPCTCPTFVTNTTGLYSITGASTAISTVGWTQGNLIINNAGVGNISMSMEAYAHHVFEPRNDKHMEAYAHLTEKGDWPDWFKEELKSYGVKLGDQPTIWRELLDLKIHKVHGGFCANREQLLLDFLQWAEAGDICLAASKSGDADAHYEPLDDAEAAELVRAYLDSGL